MRHCAKLSQVLLVCLMCLSFSGCWFIVVGGAGAVGGYAITRDTFEGVTNKSQEELMTAGHKVLAIMGNIVNEDLKEGKIEARVYGNRVVVTAIQINLTTSKLRVKARNGIFPRIGLAQDIYTKIMNMLEQ